MCKNKTILEEIVFPVLTEMFPTTTSRKLALKHPNAYNVEHVKHTHTIYHSYFSMRP